jgi:hypothetical protein
MDTTREAHRDEHIVPSPVLHPDQFAGQGATSIGAMSLNRVGSTSGSEMSEDAHSVAGSLQGAAGRIETGQV